MNLSRCTAALAIFLAVENVASAEDCPALKSIEWTKWSPTGSYLLTAGTFGDDAAGEPTDAPTPRVNVWNLSMGKKVAEIDAPVGGNYIVQAVWTSRAVVFFGNDSGTSCSKWSIGSWRQTWTELCGATVDAVLDRGGNYAYATGAAGYLLRQSIRQNTLESVDEPEPGDAWVRLSPDGKTVLHLHPSGISLYAVADIARSNGTTMHLEVAGTNCRNYDCLASVAPSSDRIAIAEALDTPNAWAGVYDVGQRKRVVTFSPLPHGTESGLVREFAWSRDGKQVYVLSRGDSKEDKFSVYDAKTGKRTHDISTTASRVKIVPGAESVVLDSDLWDFKRGKLIRSSQALVSSTLISPTRFVESGVRVVDLASGTPVAKGTETPWSCANGCRVDEVNAAKTVFTVRGLSDNSLGLVRAKDGERLKLFVFRDGKKQISFALAPNGDYEGPDTLKECIGKSEFVPVKKVNHLMQRFFTKL